MISYSLLTKPFNIFGVARWCKGKALNGFQRIDGISLSSTKYMIQYKEQQDRFYSLFPVKDSSYEIYGLNLLKEYNFIHINAKYKKDII